MTQIKKIRELSQISFDRERSEFVLVLAKFLTLHFLLLSITYS